MEKKLSKEMKIIIILLIILFFLLIIIGITIAVGTIAKENEKEKSNTKNEEYKDQITITCSIEENKDDVVKTEQVYLEKGVLITRTDISKWNKTIPREDTCKYYQTQTAKLNNYVGISSSVNCDTTSGTATTIYTISELDRTKTKLKQYDYLNEDNIFDYRSWMNYMQTKEYTCEISS